MSILRNDVMDCNLRVISCVDRREFRQRGKERVPLKSRDWVMAKKERKRKQGRYVESCSSDVM